MTHKPDMEAFRLSRIQAAGWNAALQSWALRAPHPKNPYHSEPERGRWNQGFITARKARQNGG